jgi:PEP-CTERM motif-containing protein
MLRRTFLATVAMLGLAATANAGSVYLYMVVDPATTAGAGVPAAGGFSITSTRSGAGTWHLFAVDDADGSSGIAQVKASLIGTVPVITNRLTQTLYDTADDTGFKAGLTLLRSAANANPITGSSELIGTQPFTQTGQGITAGNYSGIPGATAFSGTTNGQWGLYNDGATTAGSVLGTGHIRNALFVAEGTYTGLAPVVDLATSLVAYYTQGGTSSATAIGGGATNPLIANTNPFIPEPATMTLVGLAVVGFGGLVGRRRS